jgi:hypothetical protein
MKNKKTFGTGWCKQPVRKVKRKIKRAEEFRKYLWYRLVLRTGTKVPLVPVRNNNRYQRCFRSFSSSPNEGHRKSRSYQQIPRRRRRPGAPRRRCRPHLASPRLRSTAPLASPRLRSRSPRSPAPSLSSSAAHQNAAAAAPADEEEAGEQGPFPIEQLQVRFGAHPSLPSLLSLSIDPLAPQSTARESRSGERRPHNSKPAWAPKP